MSPSIDKLFREIESQRKKTLDLVSDFTQEQLNSNLLPGKWSVAQILSHLITAEQMSVRYMQKKILGIKTISDSGIWGEIKMMTIKLSQRMPGLKFKAPKVVVDHTTHYKDIQIIREEWERVRNDLKSLLEQISDEQVNRKIYKHAIAGYLSVRHGLMFMREHVIHHTPQIKKLVTLK